MVIAVVGYSIVLLIVFGRVLLPPEGQMIFGDDIQHQYYFFREFFNHFLRSGVFPWWNPYIFGGQPYIADPMVNIWYPATWLFFLLPLNVAYSWHIIIHIFWACMGMYVLVHTITANKGTRLDPAAWASGVIFGLSGFFMARTWAGHVDVIAAAAWMPWVVYAFLRVMKVPHTGHISSEEKKSVAVASITFALQLLSGYQTMAFFTLIAVFIFALVRSVVKKSIRSFVWVVAAGSVGIGLATIQLIPVQEFFRQSIRTYRLPYTWVSYGSWGMASFVQFLQPFFYGNQRTYTGLPPNFIEHSVFVGVGGLVLAVIGFVILVPMLRSWITHRTSREALIYGCGFIGIALFGVWVSLGPNAPVDLQYALWRMVPMYHYLRIPPRHLILVVFGLAGLAGIGLAAIRASYKKWSYFTVLIVGILVVEMIWFGRNFVELTPVPEMRHDKELIALLTRDKEPYRVFQNFGVWLSARDALDFDSVMSYGIYSATGYDTSMLRSYYEYIAQATGRKGSDMVLLHDVQVPYLSPAQAQTIDALNIKYIMVPLGHDPFSGNYRYRLIRDDGALYRLYENTTVLPRFYLRNQSCGTAEVVSYSPNRIELTTDSTCDTTLDSSEVWYPGWEAYIDGKKTSINKTNNVFRTLFVSSGKHTVLYRYHPVIFYRAAGISIITACMLLYWVRKPGIDVSRRRGNKWRSYQWF